MKNTIKLICLIILGVIFSRNSVLGQKYHKAPIGYQLKAEKIPVVSIDNLSDKEYTDRATKVREKQEKLMATGKSVNINYKARAKKRKYKSGFLYQLEVYVKGVRGIAFIFDNFELKDGAEFYIYNQERTVSAGPFTAVDVADSTNFATLPLSGDKIILELYDPERRNTSKIHIEGISLVPAAKSVTQSYVINTSDIGVNCMEGYEWQKEKNAVVALIERSGELGHYNYLFKNTAVLVAKRIPDNTVHILCSKTNFTDFYPDMNAIRNIVWHSFVIFNFETTYCGTKDLSLEKIMNYPHVYSMAFHGVGYSGDKSYNMAVMYIPQERIPVNAQYYQLGWDISTDNYSSYSPFVIIGHASAGQFNSVQYARSKSIAYANYASPSSNNGNFRVNTTSGNADFDGAPLIDQANHRLIGIYSNYGEVTPRTFVV